MTTKVSAVANVEDALPKRRIEPAVGPVVLEPLWVRTVLITVALLFLTAFLIVPLVAVFAEAFKKGWEAYVAAIIDPDAISAIKLTLITAAIAVPLNLVFGVAASWCIAKFEFRGKSILLTLIDLPFSVSPVISGLIYVLLFCAQGWFGQFIEGVLGIKVAFTPLGVVVALTFIGLPFVVRTVQPVLEEAERELEEAAASLGASSLQIFSRVVFPTIMPALLTGFALAFARATGEYGSVIFIAGNMPMISEITPLFIITKLEQYDYAGATAIAVVLLLASFLMLLAINLLQSWTRNRAGKK